MEKIKISKEAIEEFLVKNVKEIAGFFLNLEVDPSLSHIYLVSKMGNIEDYLQNDDHRNSKFYTEQYFYE